MFAISGNGGRTVFITRGKDEGDMPPGTEFMPDGKAGTTLVPRPSSDPHDPLNWGIDYKVMVMMSQWIFTWISVTGALSIAPMFPLLRKEFDLTNSQLSFLTGITVITLGFANFFIVPLSNIFGRRAISLSFSILIFLTCIWQAVAKTHSSLVAARALNGLFCATSESIPMQVIADMFFLHNRGLWTGVYFTGYFLGAFLGPVMAGSISHHYGWRSFFWLETGLSGFAIVLLLCTFPETKFHPQLSVKLAGGQADQEYSISSSSTESPASSGTETTMVYMEGVNNSRVYWEEEEKNLTALPQVPTITSHPNYGKYWPSSRQFHLWQPPDRRWKRFIVRDTLVPLKLFLNPIVLWASLMLAGPADLVLFFNITESVVLSHPPYNFNPQQVGYTNFAFVIGALIGLCTAGPFSDWVAKRKTIKNKGIREAEFRLRAIWPYMVITILSCILGGLAYQRHWHWAHIVVWGYGFAGLSVTSVPTIAIAYAVDSYKHVAGEIMVVATVFKNFIAFSYSYWVFDLALGEGGLAGKPRGPGQGWVLPAMVVLACCLVPALFGIGLQYGWGKSVRRLTRRWEVHRMEDIIN